MIRDDVKCKCVGDFGPNPDCGACGDDGTVTRDVPVLMNKKLYQIAAKSVKKVYKINFDLGTVEFDIYDVMYRDEWIQVLAIAGSNEALDWVWNFNLMSWGGVKLAGYLSARKIYKSKQFKRLRNPDAPLLVAVHSKSGPTGVAFKRKYGCDWLIAFAPAPSLRRWTNRNMENTALFRDPDDIVHKAGIVNFGQPIVPKELDHWAPNDHKGLEMDDHGIDNFIEFVDSLPDIGERGGMPPKGL